MLETEDVLYVLVIGLNIVMVVLLLHRSVELHRRLKANRKELPPFTTTENLIIEDLRKAKYLVVHSNSSIYAQLIKNGFREIDRWQDANGNDWCWLSATEP